jgi:ubiquinone/menaquinone biosynthesis C-methylase UbiE
MSALNNWADPSRAGAQDIAEMAAALEARGRADDQAAVNAALINVLAPTPGERLLEAGCGTGLLCRPTAVTVAPGGSVTGVDISPQFVQIARNTAGAAGLGQALLWCAGRAECLPFRDGCFDGALAARLLLHVANPEAVLRELRRVVRPGGRVLAMDWDFDTSAVDHSDRDLTRRVLHWRCDHHGGNNWSGRQLWRQMAAAGLSEVKAVPVVSVARHAQDSLTLSLLRAAQVTRDGGGITPAEHDAWVAELQAAIAAGRFFASIVYFIVIGKR